MHSSGMRTACLLTVSQHALCRGVSAYGRFLLRGGGGSTQGGGGVADTPGLEADTPSVNRMADRQV